MKLKAKVIGVVLVVGLALAATYFRSTDEGVTPLMIASHEGNSLSVERLISAGEDLDEISAYGWTALMFASMQGNEDVVHLLVDAGADLDIISREVPQMGFLERWGGYSETTALYEAIINENLSIAEYLLDQNVFVSQEAFTVAGSRGTPALLELMVNKGAQIDPVSTSLISRTALTEAARSG
ncbi:Ankyrin repeat-containing protein [Octadecabacter temperatus]|uniref:Ankyrin repeat protein n=1 Tax=Octadecabacter temperatus TaxID=1458307 RepID=A0A0K0Y1P5_9RHOB|nr:ankyrin repeat domain-containing protein [Octadecabacter temperatus]AKS44827.1 Ankyrin repeat protein [Octadecabacter temperatus]SIO34819.1 Ankyrin repeat-containing protein [Octadecabacter temperatus]